MKGIRRKVGTVLALLVLAMAPAIVATAAPAGAATSCAREKFTGSVARMEHYLRCNHIRFDVVIAPHLRPNPTSPGRPVESPAAAMARTVGAVRPAGGGPSCTWLAKHLVEACSQRGVPHLICAQWWHGDYYPYHCGPLRAYSITHMVGLGSVIPHLFRNHWVRACAKGAVAGSPTAVIMKVAGAGTGVGIIAGVGGGCIGGMLTWWFKV